MNEKKLVRFSKQALQTLQQLLAGQQISVYQPNAVPIFNQLLQAQAEIDQALLDIDKPPTQP